jgi:hypothetical protein
MVVGTGFTLQGFLIVFFLIPKNEPIKTSGEEQQIQSNNKTIISVNFI